MNYDYTVLSCVDHNGTRYEPGQEITLAEDAAAPLLAVRVIEKAEDQKSKPKPGPGHAVR
jgi:hypothetical protein